MFFRNLGNTRNGVCHKNHKAFWSYEYFDILHVRVRVAVHWVSWCRWQQMNRKWVKNLQILLCLQSLLGSTDGNPWSRYKQVGTGGLQTKLSLRRDQDKTCGQLETFSTTVSLLLASFLSEPEVWMKIFDPTYFFANQHPLDITRIVLLLFIWRILRD